VPSRVVAGVFHIRDTNHPCPAPSSAKDSVRPN
jgi:hypothetical protein